jgi:hypothetical protein
MAEGDIIMNHKATGFVVLCLLALTLASPGEARERSRWDFTVYLDQKKIGQHSFEVTNSDGITQVRSEARFRYRFLLIPAYSYDHSAAERWSDDCLLGLDADTVTNGDRIRVSGERRDGGFTVVSDDGPANLPECVMSFAYWNPDFLEQQRLLNPQTGEYVSVQIEAVGADRLEVNGELVDARRYRLRAYDLDLTLWYSEDDEWLGLESVARNGRVVRYELS